MIDRKLRKKIEWAFYNYNNNKLKAAEYIDDNADALSAVDYSQLVVQGGFVTDSTARQGARLAEQNEPYLWCLVVEKTLEYFKFTGKDKLIELKYFNKLSEYYQCIRLHIERQGLYDWVNAIINYAIIGAAQLGLVKIF